MRALQVLGAALVVLALTAAPLPARAGINYVYLSIDLLGLGSGSFKTLGSEGGVPDGWIDCRQVNGYTDPRESCDFQWDAGDDGVIRIYYRVAPAPGSCLDGAGPCTEAGYSSYFDLTGELSRTYTFNPSVYDVFVYVDGSGKVVTDELTVSCPTDCTAKYYYEHPVRLTATANPGSHFVNWGGDCAGQPALCQIAIKSNLAVSAYFALGPAPTPLVTPGVTPLVTPVVTPAATPKTTPKASTGATAGATPRASATTKPGTAPATAPGTSPGASPGAAPGTSAAVGSAGPSESAWASAGPTVLGGTIGPPSPGDSTAATAPVVPVASEPGSGSELTPIILAILGAGLFIAIAIGLVGFWVVRRSRGSSGARPSA